MGKNKKFINATLAQAAEALTRGLDDPALTPEERTSLAALAAAAATTVLAATTAATLEDD